MIASTDRIIAAKTLAQEVRGEPTDGQLAVAHVLVNRKNDGRWGKNYTSLCLWSGFDHRYGKEVFQFSGWSPRDPNYAYACGLRDDDPVIVKMLFALEQAENSPDDMTNGALFYYAERIAAPSWAPTMRPCGKFGTQIFLSDRPSQSGVPVA